MRHAFLNAQNHLWQYENTHTLHADCGMRLFTPASIVIHGFLRVQTATPQQKSETAVVRLSITTQLMMNFVLSDLVAAPCAHQDQVQPLQACKLIHV